MADGAESPMEKKQFDLLEKKVAQIIKISKVAVLVALRIVGGVCIR